MITSMANTQMKKINKLKKQIHARRQEGLFVVEGWKMVSEALSHGLVANLFVREQERESYESRLCEAGCQAIPKDIPVAFAADSVFRQLSDTVAPQGILAVVRMPRYDREKIVQAQAGGIYEQAKLLVLENIQDPGNMGTILRTAEGGGNIRNCFRKGMCRFVQSQSRARYDGLPVPCSLLFLRGYYL